MNTGFLNRHIDAKSARRSLLAAGIAIALPMAACIALAQQPDANLSRMSTPNGYTARHSVDVGGRVANKVGSGAMYDTLVNLQSGPRVNAESMELHKLPTNKNAIVDDASLSGSGFGGDPYNFVKLTMSKGNLYEFSGLFRRDRQYFDYNLLGNANVPSGITLPIGSSASPTGSLAWPQQYHSSVMTNSVRRMTDTDLTLYPLSAFSFHFGYSQNVMQGPSLQPSRSAGIFKYSGLLEQYQRHSTDEYTASIDWKPVDGTKLSFEQRFHHYKENSYFTLDPNGFLVQEANGAPAYLGNWDLSSNGSTSTGTLFAPYSTAACNSNSIASATTFLNPNPNGGKPIIDPSCAVVTSYQRTNPLRSTMPSETLRFQSTSIKNLVFNGQANYNWVKMNMPNYLENASGLNGTAVNEYFSASGVVKRDVYNVDFGLIWQALNNFSLSDQVTLSANGQPGNINISGYTKVATGTAAGQETINYTGPFTTSVTGSSLVTGLVYGNSLTYFGNEQLVNNLTASWAATPKANFSFTYRYGNRNIGVNSSVSPTTSRTVIAITQQGGILNAAYRVNNNWDINGSVEALYNDNAFTPMTPRQERHYRVHTRFHPTSWSSFTAAYNDVEKHNNTNNSGGALLYGPLNHVDHSRTASISGTIAKSEKYAVDFDYAYSDVYTATNICFANQDSGFLTGNTSPLFAGTASLSPSGALLTCPTSATNSTPTQWFARSFMDAPTQHGSVGVMLTPNEKVNYSLGYRVNSVAGSQFFTDARAVNGSLNSSYQTPYARLAYTMHPGLVWKAEYDFFGYGEGGPSGAAYCTLNSVATATTATVVPCATMAVQTGMNLSSAGETTPRTFHANNISVGLHYEF